MIRLENRQSRGLLKKEKKKGKRKKEKSCCRFRHCLPAQQSRHHAWPLGVSCVRTPHRTWAALRRQTTNTLSDKSCRPSVICPNLRTDPETLSEEALTPCTERDDGGGALANRKSMPRFERSIEPRPLRTHLPRVCACGKKERREKQKLKGVLKIYRNTTFWKGLRRSGRSFSGYVAAVFAG